MTETELKEKESRAAAATKGPWKLYPQKRREWTKGQTLEIQRADKTPVVHWVGFDAAPGTKAQKRANAKFIAHARADVPALCAALRAAWAEALQARFEVGAVAYDVGAFNAANAENALLCAAIIKAGGELEQEHARRELAETALRTERRTSRSAALREMINAAAKEAKARIPFCDCGLSIAPDGQCGTCRRALEDDNERLLETLDTERREAHKRIEQQVEEKLRAIAACELKKSLDEARIVELETHLALLQEALVCGAHAHLADVERLTGLEAAEKRSGWPWTDGVWECDHCGEMYDVSSTVAPGARWRWNGEDWEHHHCYPIGYIHATKIDEAAS